MASVLLRAVKGMASGQGRGRRATFGAPASQGAVQCGESCFLQLSTGPLLVSGTMGCLSYAVGTPQGRRPDCSLLSLMVIASAVLGLSPMGTSNIWS